MIQDRLKVTKQGALNLVSELGLREMTGRGRFRAWGICNSKACHPMRIAGLVKAIGHSRFRPNRAASSLPTTGH
ncbi:helix-turn-helix domain-containing protein [Mesorhizobium caraganae]|uniref:helix-turn-helix domain-containing protein n=1 Tax=Mesorhizobium caraganae TaxID=483206 RepID=UPI001FEB5E0E|nr:helix-turn-helix domain-containing protein [Mesorhizobium caraganae]